MADRYLLETSATDGYLLEDGSGVLILETSSYALTADDSVATLTDSPARAGTFARAITDFVNDDAFQADAFQNDAFQSGNISEAVVRTGTFARTVADSISSLTEAVVRILIFPRTVADSIATLTEAVIRTAGGYFYIVKTDAPIAYWRFGEASGTAAADVIGSNTGLYEGPPTLGVAGALPGDTNTAVGFGTNKNVKVTSNASLDVGDTFSFECWIRVTGGSGTNRKIAQRGAGNGWLVAMRTDNTVQGGRDAGPFFVESNTAITDSNWHHVVVCKDGSTTRKVYIDGVDDSVVTGTVTCTTTFEHLYIGYGSDEWFPGQIDEVALYNKVLNPAQIARHYAARTDNPWWPRSAVDSVATLTETASRIWTGARTTADSLPTLTEAVTRVLIATRTAADSLPTLTEAVSRAAATFTRSTSDSVSTLTEAATRIWSGVRTTADSLSTLTETVSRAPATFTRAASDSVSAITELVVRAVVIGRTAADSIPTLSEATNRVFTGVRAVADTIGSITEAVVAVVTGGTIIRTVSDSISSISESASRIANLSRAASDNISTLVEAVTRTLTGSRIVSDSVSAISELPTRIATTARTLADSVGSISESIVRSVGVQRAATDVISAISEAVTRTGTFSRSVADSIESIFESVARPLTKHIRSAISAITSRSRISTVSKSSSVSANNPRSEDE